jgi:hypothetical protein
VVCFFVSVFVTLVDGEVIIGFLVLSQHISELKLNLTEKYLTELSYHIWLV